MVGIVVEKVVELVAKKEVVEDEGPEEEVLEALGVVVGVELRVDDELETEGEDSEEVGELDE